MKTIPLNSDADTTGESPEKVWISPRLIAFLIKSNSEFRADNQVEGYVEFRRVHPRSEVRCPYCDSGLVLSEEEVDAVVALSTRLGLSPNKVWHQALRVFQLHVLGEPDLSKVDPRSEGGEGDAQQAFDKWWATKVAEGYQYGRGPLATVRFGFEAGFAAASQVESEVAWRLAMEAAATEGQRVVKGMLESQGVLVTPDQAGYLTATAIRSLPPPPQSKQEKE